MTVSSSDENTSHKTTSWCCKDIPERENQQNLKRYSKKQKQLTLRFTTTICIHEKEPLIEVPNQNTNSNEFNLASLNTTQQTFFSYFLRVCFAFTLPFIHIKIRKLYLKLFWISRKKGRTKLNKNVRKKKFRMKLLPQCIAIYFVMN